MESGRILLSNQSLKTYTVKGRINCKPKAQNQNVTSVVITAFFFCISVEERRLLSLAFKHCLRFSCASLPGGAAANNKRGNTAWIAEGYIPPTPPGNSHQTSASPFQMKDNG